MRHTPKHYANGNRRALRGNILFLILLAVVLFAALSYAVTSSMRGGGKDASENIMDGALNEILNVVTQHRTAITRMIMSGINPDNISANYGAATGAGNYNVQNAKCTSNACRLYHPDGGGLSYYDFTLAYPELTTAPYGTTSNGPFLSTFFYYPGTSAYDLVYIVRVTRDFCDYINKTLGVASLTSFTGFGSATLASALAFTHTLNGGGLSMTPTTLPPSGWAQPTGHGSNMAGKEMGCIHSTHVTDSYYFLALLYSF